MSALMKLFKQYALLRLFFFKTKFSLFHSNRLPSGCNHFRPGLLIMLSKWLSHFFLCVSVSLSPYSYCLVLPRLLLKDNFGIVELVLRVSVVTPSPTGQPDTSVTSMTVYGGRLGGISSVSNKVPFFRWGFSLTLKSLPCPWEEHRAELRWYHNSYLRPAFGLMTHVWWASLCQDWKRVQSRCSLVPAFLSTFMLYSLLPEPSLLAVWFIHST